MDFYTVKFSSEAARNFRELELFDRQFVYDAIENFRIGRGLDEDFGEVTESGEIELTIIRNHSAIRYMVDHEAKIVQIFGIESADH